MQEMREDLEKRLEELEARANYYRDQYDFLLGQIPNPTFLIDPEHDRIVEVNAAACRLLGYSREELTGSLHVSDIHPGEMDVFLAFREEVFRNGKGENRSLTCVTADGRSLPVTIHATYVEGATGARLIRAIVVDHLPEQAMEQALLDEVKNRYDFEEVVGRSAALQEVMRQVELVASTDSAVLLRGETGTGKELICRAIHHGSRRSRRPLVKLNCAAIPSGLVESELFGHEKGAFTGAISQKRGRFELAHQGTIFLDEIGDIPLDLQPKLLRLLQEQEFERVGGTRTIKVDTRIITATHRDLEGLVAEGAFREDLFYRLNVFPIALPPLRERREDIPLLARYFAARIAARHGRPPSEFAPAAMERLLAYDWPGNVRELENIVERALILSRGELIEIQHVHVGGNGRVSSDRCVRTMQEAEREHILAALRSTNWKVSGDGGAAQLLDLKPTTLASRMKKLGISRDKDAPAP